MSLKRAIGILLYLLFSPAVATALVGNYLPLIGYGVIIMNLGLIFYFARRNKNKKVVDDSQTLPKICTYCGTKYPESAIMCKNDFANLSYRKSLGDNV